MESPPDVRRSLPPNHRLHAAREFGSVGVPGLRALSLARAASLGPERADRSFGLCDQPAHHVPSAASHAVNEPMMVSLPQIAIEANTGRLHGIDGNALICVKTELL
jgi:hypothetical protein